jgi:ketosteroid isomerase-like protein
MALSLFDSDCLATFVTDDIVRVHGNGRCVCGKEELKADFLKSFGRFDFDRRFPSSEIIVRDKWAVKICEVESTLTGVRGGIQVEAHDNRARSAARHLMEGGMGTRIAGLTVWRL